MTGVTQVLTVRCPTKPIIRRQAKIVKGSGIAWQFETLNQCNTVEVVYFDVPFLTVRSIVSKETERPTVRRDCGTECALGYQSNRFTTIHRNFHNRISGAIDYPLIIRCQ